MTTATRAVRQLLQLITSLTCLCRLPLPCVPSTEREQLPLRHPCCAVLLPPRAAAAETPQPQHPLPGPRPPLSLLVPSSRRCGSKAKTRVLIPSARLRRWMRRTTRRVALFTLRRIHLPRPLQQPPTRPHLSLFTSTFSSLGTIACTQAASTGHTCRDGGTAWLACGSTAQRATRPASQPWLQDGRL